MSIILNILQQKMYNYRFKKLILMKKCFLNFISHAFSNISSNIKTKNINLEIFLICTFKH